MINWIECNLYFYKLEMGYLDYSEAPDTHELAVEKFGQEQMDKYYNNINFNDPEQSKFNDRYFEWENNLSIIQQHWKCIEELEKEFFIKEQERINATKTFCGENLNIPGTLIELEDGSRYLIGDSTSEGVISGADYYNTMIPREVKVTRYAIIYTKE